MKNYLSLIGLSFLLACSSSNSDSTVVPPTPSPPIEPPVVVPKIVWDNWYLSVPIDKGNGKATSIFTEDLRTGNLSTEAQEYFYENADGSYSMFTKFTGFTTSGQANLNSGKYCRTELREFWRGNQDVWDNWYMNTGVHEMQSTLKVDYVEGNGKTIVAQIHGKETTGLVGSPATVKIRWTNGDIIIDHYTKPGAGEPWTSAYSSKPVIGNVGFNKFTVGLKIEGGKFYFSLTCPAENIDTGYVLIYDYVGNGYGHQNYFKTGNYFSWNSDYTKTAKVNLYEVVTVHQ